MVTLGNAFRRLKYISNNFLHLSFDVKKQTLFFRKLHFEI